MMMFNSHDSEDTNPNKKLKLGKKIYRPVTLVLILGLVMAGCTSADKEKEMNTTQMQKPSQEKEMVESEAMTKTSENYQNYTPEKIAALKGKEKFIAFFHAEWCPTCRVWEKNILNADLASNVKILKVDYDTQAALKKEYGVTTQSTAVFFNADGSIAKTEGSPAIEVVKNFFN